MVDLWGYIPGARNRSRVCGSYCSYPDPASDFLPHEVCSLALECSTGTSHSKETVVMPNLILLAEAGG